MVLMDLVMSGMDGAAATKAIRATHAGVRGCPGADPAGAQAADAGLRSDRARAGGAGLDGRGVE
jgi:CheY-like chemotaxis protein